MEAERGKVDKSLNQVRSKKTLDSEEKEKWGRGKVEEVGPI